MPGTAGPNLGLIWGFSAHESGWGLGGYNPGFAILDTLVMGTIISVLDAAPGSPADGDRYIVGTGSGAFATHNDEVAVWSTIGTPAWLFLPPVAGWRMFNAATNSSLRWTGAAWITETKYGFGFSSDAASLHTASQILVQTPMMTDVIFPANFGAYNDLQSYAYGSVAATATTTFLVRKAALATPTVFSNVGTVVVTAGDVVTTMTTAGGVELPFDAGDIFQLIAPVAPDATLKGLFGAFAGFEA